MSDSGSLREAIAVAMEGTLDWRVLQGRAVEAEVYRAVAQWFRDHETERVEAGARAMAGENTTPDFVDELAPIFAPNARAALRASDAVVFPAREEKSDV